MEREVRARGQAASLTRGPALPAGLGSEPEAADEPGRVFSEKRNFVFVSHQVLPFPTISLNSVAPESWLRPTAGVAAEEAAG